MRIFLPVCLLIASGCATAISGTNESVWVDSVPRNATFILNDHLYRTPASVTLSRTRSYDIVIQKEGFLEARRVVVQVGNSASTGNLLVGGAVGILIDQSSGAAFRLYPTMLSVELAPTTPSERVYKSNGKSEKK